MVATGSVVSAVFPLCLILTLSSGTLSYLVKVIVWADLFFLLLFKEFIWAKYDSNGAVRKHKWLGELHWQEPGEGLLYRKGGGKIMAPPPSSPWAHIY